MSRDSDEASVNRRSVLKGITAAGAATAGLAAGGGSAAAKQARAFGDEYSRPEVARVGFEAHTEELREELVNYGVLESAAASEFDLESSIDHEKQAREAGEEGFTTLGVVDEGEPSAHIIVSKHTERYAVSVHVLPQRESRYAVVRDTVEDEEFVIDPDTESVKLTASDRCSSNETRCTSTCCEHQDGYEYEEEETCYFDHGFEMCLCYWTQGDCECAAFNCNVVDWP